MPHNPHVLSLVIEHEQKDTDEQLLAEETVAQPEFISAVSHIFNTVNLVKPSSAMECFHRALNTGSSCRSFSYQPYEDFALLSPWETSPPQCSTVPSDAPTITLSMIEGLRVCGGPIGVNITSSSATNSPLIACGQSAEFSASEGCQNEFVNRESLPEDEVVLWGVDNAMIQEECGINEDQRSGHQTPSSESVQPPNNDITSQENDSAENEGWITSTCSLSDFPDSRNPGEDIPNKSSDDNLQTNLPSLAGPAAETVLLDDSSNWADWQTWINDGFLQMETTAPMAGSETVSRTEEVCDDHSRVSRESLPEKDQVALQGGDAVMILEESNGGGIQTSLLSSAGPSTETALDCQSWMSDDSATCVDAEEFSNSHDYGSQSSLVDVAVVDSSDSIGQSDRTSVHSGCSDVMVDDSDDDTGSDPYGARSYTTPVSNPSNTPKPASTIATRDCRVPSSRPTRNRVAKRKKQTQNCKVVGPGRKPGKSSSKLLMCTSEGTPTHGEDQVFSSPLSARPSLLATDQVFHALKSTFPALSDVQLEQVREIGNSFFPDDLPQFLARRSNIWRTEGFWNQPELKLEITRKALPKDNYVEVHRYVGALERRDESNFIRIRLGRTLLYLFYHDVLKKMCERSLKRSGKFKTQAMNCLQGAILSAGCGEVLGVKSTWNIREHIRRQKRVGERWWRLSCIGLGVLLLCRMEAGNKINKLNFTIPMVDALAMYLLNAYPNAVALCRKLDDKVRCLLLKQPSSDQLLSAEVQAWANRAPELEQPPRSVQQPWKAIGPDSMAEQALQDFLREWAG